MRDSCATCKYSKELWWWKHYPQEKQYGHCCTALLGEGVVMQLYGKLDAPGSRCEMFSENGVNYEREYYTRG